VEIKLAPVTVVPTEVCAVEKHRACHSFGEESHDLCYVTKCMPSDKSHVTLGRGPS